MAVYPYQQNSFNHKMVASVTDEGPMSRTSTQVWTVHNKPAEGPVQVKGVVAVRQDARMELGQPRDTTVRVFIRRTYPALYNHVVRNMNSLTDPTDTQKKWSMRGGHFFLYRYIIFFAIILCFSFGIASIFVKACSAVPFVLTVLYIALSIFNIVVYFRNKPVLRQLVTAEVPSNELNGFINRFFTVPINAQIQTGVAAAFFDPARILAIFQERNIAVTELEVMLYDHHYLARSKFPKEIIVHLIIFLILFILAIVFVSTTVTRGKN